MRNVILFVCALFVGSAVAAPLKKQMCFETIPRTTIDINGTHQWTINEIIADPSLYQTYQIIFYSQVKDKNGFVNLGFTGHGRNGYGFTVPVSGSGYIRGEKLYLQVNASYVVNVPNADDTTVYPIVNSIAFWDMYANVEQPGSSRRATNIVDGNFLPIVASNIYETAVIKGISCSDYNRLTPTQQ